jgi:ketosteroid isomerase-like protein
MKGRVNYDPAIRTEEIMKLNNILNLKKSVIFLFIAFAFSFSGFQAFGEEWTDEQKEVWASIQEFWDSIKNGDLDGALSRHHDKMIVWLFENPDPSRKDQTRSEYYTLINRSVPTKIKLKPLEINIVGDVANVFYLSKWVSLNEEKSSSCRVLVTMIKQDNKWVWIGSHDSSCDRLSPCPYKW